MSVKLILLTLISFQSFAGTWSYPKAPDLTQTPGSLCDTPDTYRHPEQIPYCERNVNTFMKESIFLAYRKLGYSLSGERSEYKIDHFIPLCLGGSNKPDNLWPQHQSISKLSDPIEAIGCEVLGKGNITQKELIERVVKAKLDISQAPKTFKYLKSLRHK